MRRDRQTYMANLINSFRDYSKVPWKLHIFPFLVLCDYGVGLRVAYWRAWYWEHLDWRGMNIFEGGVNCIMRPFVICILYQTIQWHEWKWDGTSFSTVEGDRKCVGVSQGMCVTISRSIEQLCSGGFLSDFKLCWPIWFVKD